MTTEEAIERLEHALGEPSQFDHEAQADLFAVSVLKAALARVTAERDRLIEAWPDSTYGVVTRWDERRWYAEGIDEQLYATREAAVRAAAGLDAKPE